jgi:hypothetical protein
MAWEWNYSSNDRQWTLTVAEWQAVVHRVEGPRYLWHAYIERITEPHERHEGLTSQAAVDGRAWCLKTIAGLRAKGQSS